MDKASPRIGVRALDAARLRQGRGRTIGEIAAWPGASPAGRAAIWRRGGRASGA